jgi:HlyD family secretion protein
MVPGKVIRIDSPKQIGTVAITPVIVALDVPHDTQAGAEVTGRIDVVTVKDAIYIPRPALAPAQSLLYRLNSDQTGATPVQVEYGRLGADVAEIRSGLSPGDRVIVSSTAQYEPFGKIALR